MEVEELKYIGLDSWDRPVYKDSKKRLWKDVDPLSKCEPNLCSAQYFEAEPENPWPAKKKFELLPNRVVWR